MELPNERFIDSKYYKTLKKLYEMKQFTINDFENKEETEEILDRMTCMSPSAGPYDRKDSTEPGPFFITRYGGELVDMIEHFDSDAYKTKENMYKKLAEELKKKDEEKESQFVGKLNID